jgi:choline dehydrogenase-like flavoprotein
MAEDYDVVIIGAGVAGGLCAWRLSQGQNPPKILLLEEGDNGLEDGQRQQFVDAYMRAPIKGTTSPYSELPSAKVLPSPESGSDRFVLNRYFVEVGPDLYKSNYLRVLGGSTWTWRGNTPRFIPSDFKLKELYGVGADWPISYDDVEPWYCEAEQQLGVAGNDQEWNNLFGAHRSKPFPMPNIVPSYGDRLVMKAVNGMKIDGKTVEIVTMPQARTSQPYHGRKECEGYASCIPICPNGAKYDASVHLKKAVAQGVELRAGAVVTGVELEPGGGSAVRTIRFKQWAAPDKGEQRVTSKLVVFAANAIETTKLWLLSGLANRSDQVGRNLMDHLAEDVTCLFPEPIYPFRGPQSNCCIEVFRDGPARKNAGAFRMTIGMDGWGRKEHPFASLDKLMWSPQDKKLLKFGDDLQHDLVHRVTRMLRIGYSTEQLPNPNNRVTLSDEKDTLDIPRPRITYSVDDYSKKALAYGQRVARQILEHIDGAEEIDPVEPTFNYNGAGHVMGTLRMGPDKYTSVVDSHGRAHEHPNLYVLGSSVFATSSTANPTITVAALALRTAEAIASDLSNPP